MEVFRGRSRGVIREPAYLLQLNNISADIGHGTGNQTSTDTRGSSDIHPSDHGVQCIVNGVIYHPPLEETVA
jgi:hypothetical protein